MLMYACMVDKQFFPFFLKIAVVFSEADMDDPYCTEHPR